MQHLVSNMSGSDWLFAGFAGWWILYGLASLGRR